MLDTGSLKLESRSMPSGPMTVSAGGGVLRSLSMLDVVQQLAVDLAIVQRCRENRSYEPRIGMMYGQLAEPVVNSEVM
jgi:hypothetical protein